jgi:starch phosphorylase
MDIKQHNKKKLAGYISECLHFDVDPESLFDVQIKRIHEYKRQLLNILYVITRYNSILQHPEKDWVPRTIIFGGKAAPSYTHAKLIIKLIHDVAEVINNDSIVRHFMKVAFVPDYDVSKALRIIPAADLSEQISTAGMEASGTGNMKLSLNGALTIGTLDGANIEICEEVGEDNIFIFGLSSDGIEKLRAEGYQPHQYADQYPPLKQTLNMIHSGYFSPDKPNRYHSLIDHLLSSDYFMLLADFEDYARTQERVDELYQKPQEWARQALINVANMGKFSSDRTITEYAEKIWNINPKRQD